MERKYRKKDKRKKYIAFFVIVFVVAMSFSYLGLYQKSKKLEKEQQQVEAQIKKEKEKKKELKKKKEYIKTREFIEKMATEKFGLLYPDEFLLKADE
nr:septum formation initiator family protein [Anaerostipes faecalis]